MSDIVPLVMKKTRALEKNSAETKVYPLKLSPILEPFLIIINFSDIIGLPVSPNISTLSLCLSQHLLVSS